MMLGRQNIPLLGSAGLKTPGSGHNIDELFQTHTRGGNTPQTGLGAGAPGVGSTFGGGGVGTLFQGTGGVNAMNPVTRNLEPIPDFSFSRGTIGETESPYNIPTEDDWWVTETIEGYSDPRPSTQRQGEDQGGPNTRWYWDEREMNYLPIRRPQGEASGPAEQARWAGLTETEPREQRRRRTGAEMAGLGFYTVPEFDPDAPSFGGSNPWAGVPDYVPRGFGL